MHPLLVSAVANTAGNLLDRWTRGAGVAAPQRSQGAQFDQMLDSSSAANSAAPAKKSPALLRQEHITKLRDELLNAPEIRAVLDTADPSKPTTLSLSPDGRVMSTKAGYDPKPILLSPEIAEIARELANLSSPTGSTLPPPSVMGFSSLHQARISGIDLTPKADFTVAR